MSDNGKVVSVFTCPVCHHKKTPIQRDLVCGKCVHQTTEIIRNSVVENEALNKQMRIQIDHIFRTCSNINEPLPENVDHGTNLVISATEKARNIDIPQPDKSSLCQLALHLQKLEVMNRKIKSNGLQKSQEYLEKKNQALENKIGLLTLSIEQNHKLILLAQTRMFEEYSRKLEHLDREIISVKYEGMRRVSRQAALKQYSSYKIIRENYFSTTLKAELNFCSRPVLTIPKFPETQITTVNTYLEDMTRLLIVLYDLFTIDDDTLQLPYLEQLRKLLPERSFYDSVQKKIDIILQNDGTIPGENKEPEASKEPVTENVHSEIAQKDFGKITIKHKKIQVPKSFRTMNLQRRSSVKEPYSSDENSLPGAETQIPKNTKSAFVMVAQEKVPVMDDMSPKSSLRSPAHEGKTVGKSGNQNLKSISSGNGTKMDWHGKKIVIVPHRILPKPFSKLRPSEYLKFISIVVKILVTFNELLHKVLGISFMKSDSEIRQNYDIEVEKSRFVYDFREILLKVSNLDQYFQQKAHTQTQMQASIVKDTGITNNIDASELTPHGDEDKSMRESWASESSLSVSAIPRASFQKFRSLYTKLVSKTRGSEPTAGLFSPSDNIIYGMVSETSPPIEAAKSRNINGTTEENQVKNEQESKGYDLKEILQKVHDMISGNPNSSEARARGGNRLANIDQLGAKSVMQQSRAHLEDWDVVSKMF